jgi:hypothetical protein
MNLDEIKYRFIIDLTLFFVGKYKEGEIKEISSITHNVKTLSGNIIQEISFVYDESIWPPSNEEAIKNLIEFKVQLTNTISYLPFRLYINKGSDQEPIFINSYMNWK